MQSDLAASHQAWPRCPIPSKCRLRSLSTHTLSLSLPSLLVSAAILSLLPASLPPCLIITSTMTDNESRENHWSKTETMNNLQMLVWTLRFVICLLLCDSVALVIFCLLSDPWEGRAFLLSQIRGRCNLTAAPLQPATVCRNILWVHVLACLSNVSYLCSSHWAHATRHQESFLISCSSAPWKQIFEECQLLLLQQIIDS